MRVRLMAAAMVLCSIAGTTWAETSAVDFQGMMKPFYSDEDLKIIRSDEEVKKIFGGLKSEDQDALSTACADPDPEHKSFCDTVIRAKGDQ